MVLALPLQHAVRLLQRELVRLVVPRKLNAALILKAMSEIGVGNYAQMLVTPKEEQYPIDWLLRTIHAKLDAIPEPTRYHE